MNKSETITELSKALIEFQSKLTKVKKDGKNPHFGNKYASLSSIISSIQEPLTECGLAIIQLPEGENVLETILLHSSGEWISESYVMKPQRNDPQGVGSAITYQRRYALGAILCLNIDEDDDGEKASEEVKERRKDWIKPLAASIEKKPMPEDRFNGLCEKIKAAKDADQVVSLIKLARANFKMTDDQEAILADWEMESQNIQ